MAVDKNVNITLTAKDNVSPIAKKMGDVLGKELVANVAAVSKAFVVMNQTAQLVGATYNKIAGAINTTIQAANKQEDAINALNTSLKVSGEFSEEASLGIQAYASSLQTTSRYGDEVILQNAALIQSLGQLDSEGLKGATQAALDMAEALQVDLRTASNLVGRAATGNVALFSRYGVVIKKGADNNETFANTLAAISKQFGGTAKAKLATFSGAVAQAGNSFGDLLEKIGFLITKNKMVIDLINNSTKVFESWGKSIASIDLEVLAENTKDFAIALGIASAAVGGYIIYANAATIATAAWGVATTVVATGMAIISSPITIAVAAVAALTAGIYFLIKNLDTVVGALKVGLGYALQFVTLGLRTMLVGLSYGIGLFNKDWAGAIDNVIGKMDSMTEGLKESGRQQIKAASAAKDNADATKETAKAAEVAKKAIIEQQQALVKLNVQYSKAEASAEGAFKAAAEFSPRLKLDAFIKEQEAFEKSLVNLQKRGEDLKIKLSVSSDDTGETQKAIDEITQKQKDAEEAIRALKIKTQQEIRSSRLNEVTIELNAQKQKVFTVEQEIKQMRLNAASENRAQLIEIEKQRLLEQRGLASVASQEANTVRQAAAIEANEIELQAFKNRLNTEKQLALDVEQQKQLELINLRASLLTGSSAGAQASEDAEVIKEQQKIQQLQVLRDQELISEEQFQNDKAAIVQAGQQRSFDLELAMQQQRIQALGLSPEGLQAQLDLQREQDAMELANLRFKLEQKQLTEEEFRVASNQLQTNSEMAAVSIKEQQLQKEIALNKKKGNSFQATLKEIELSQMQHGKVMGALKAMQGSAEFQAIGGALGNLASLRDSSSRKEFEIGKKAAIAQATVATFMSATQAFASLSGIPIVGPALGAAAAAAAVVAGMSNVKNIKNQKFSGGSSGGAGAAPTASAPTATLGGQADKGMDAVPRSLSGKSFVLSAGERVVQPEANRDLTSFLKDGGNGGNTYNISINATADSNVERIKDAVIEGIREASERGQPIINSKGIVNG